jgi:hypothetical protein
MNGIIKALVDQAIKNNIMHYDNDVKNGVFSRQLQLKASNYMAQEFGEHIDFILYDDCRVIENYLRETGGSLPHGKSRLLLFVGTSTTIFGAY